MAIQARFLQPPRRALRLSPLVLTLAVGALTQPANARVKSTTVALTTTVSTQAPAPERAMMANLLSLLEVSAIRQPGIDVVERMEIDTVLHELVLSRAAGSEGEALQLGKLASAELILTAKLLEPADDGKRHVLVRITESLTGRIRGATVAPVDELIVDETAQEITSYLSAIIIAPETAGISIAVMPFESLGRFDRLRPLERGLRDMVVARLLNYRRFHVLQRSDMRELLDEIDLVHLGLTDATGLPETFPSRRAAFVLRGTIDERNSDGGQRLIVAANVVNANTKKVVDSIEFQSMPDELPGKLAVEIHRLTKSIVANAGKQDGSLTPAPRFDEVEHLFQVAVRDLYRFWRRQPRDFSHRDFRLPGVEPPQSNPPGRVPLDSPLGKAMLRKATDRLESVLYLQPERREAAFALAFCLSCHIEDLWQPDRADRLLRNVFHHDPSDQLAAAALNWLAEMYYHHESGDLKPEDENAARKQVLFAFENMPVTHRNYEWSRLVELLKRIDGRNRDYNATASVMKLAAGLTAEAEPHAQRNLASNVTNMAQSLCTAPGNPRLQAEARLLLDSWSTSEPKWQRYFAMQALAQVAQRDKDFAKAAELYRAAGELMRGERGAHDYHLNLLRVARILREAGDADEALALLQSFEPQDQRPTSLLNGMYGVELGATLESLGRKEEALETYVSYAEASAHLADNSDVEGRIKSLGGVPLRENRDIDVRYIDSPDEKPFLCRSLATDGERIFASGYYRSKRPVAAFRIATQQWESLGGPDVGAPCLACDGGYLWVGTEDEGVWRCNLATKTWKNWKLKDGLPDNKVVDIAAQRDTAFLSVGHRDAGGVIRIDALNRVHVYEGKDAPSVTLYHLTLHNGRLYGINRRLFELDLPTGAWHDSLPSEANRHFGLYGLFRAGSELWGSSYRREIFRINASPEQNALYKQAWFPAAVNSKAGYGVDFALERNGQLWFGGNPWARFKSCGFYRLDLETGDFVIYGPRDGFRLSTTYECYDGLEAAGRIWLATSAGLAEVTIRENMAKTSRTSGTDE